VAVEEKNTLRSGLLGSRLTWYGEVIQLGARAPSSKIHRTHWLTGCPIQHVGFLKEKQKPKGSKIKFMERHLKEKVEKRMG
jgi:hypothetical protein